MYLEYNIVREQGFKRFSGERFTKITYYKLYVNVLSEF